MATAEGKFTMSEPFRILMDGFVVEDGDTYDDPALIHTECGDAVCTIEHDDSMAVLVQTMLSHDCPTQPGATE